MAAAAQAPTVEDTIRLRVEQARQQPTVGVRGTRLLRPEAVARFFEARAFAPAWRVPGGGQEMLSAIRSIDLDGLTPADYHLTAIAAALEAYAKTPTADGAADLQVLIADAAAALIDHVRYGRVRPASLDKRWNVDPRAGTPPLDLALEDLARPPQCRRSVNDRLAERDAGNFRYTLRQPPGPDNALGRVKFIFPNQYSIFLHDTPSRELFASDQRTFSSGCIRVEHPLDLAARLLQGQDNWTPARIQEAVDSTEQQTVFLKTPLPVLIVYWTVSVGASGEPRYAKDVYNLDPPCCAR